LNTELTKEITDRLIKKQTKENIPEEFLNSLNLKWNNFKRDLS
jgi:hypothetical protein